VSERIWYRLTWVDLDKVALNELLLLLA